MNRTNLALLEHVNDGCGCGCGENPCGCLPTEFTRLRYSYGLRLGAVELSDEQGYLVGKHRFHNARCHGSGVLCGLEADRFVWPQGAPTTTPSTVLRVSRGAAMDQCGREILVPCDQCIDVAAWFGKNSAKLDLPADTTTLVIRIALRYRECPSDPAPVPRDPCGCDSAGCDYSRVREGFELALFAINFPACAGDVFPTTDALLTALGGTASPTSDFSAALNAAVAAGCPQTLTDEWICLADFTATLTTGSGGAPLVTDISTPDNTISGRHTLLSTAALQALVLSLAGITDPQSVLVVGPTIGSPSFAGAGPDSGTLTIPINLITDPNQSSPTALADGTFQAQYVQVSSFDGTKWNPAPASTPSYAAGQVSVTWGAASGLAPGNYRVSLLSPDDQPIVDQRMRPLRPARFTWNFGLSADSNNNNQLILAPVSL